MLFVGVLCQAPFFKVSSFLASPNRGKRQDKHILTIGRSTWNIPAPKKSKTNSRPDVKLCNMILPTPVTQHCKPSQNILATTNKCRIILSSARAIPSPKCNYLPTIANPHLSQLRSVQQRAVGSFDLDQISHHLQTPQQNRRARYATGA